MHTHTKEFQQKLTPRKAYEVLVEGNGRFMKNLRINRNLLQQMNETMDGQYPFAVVLSCMDSRTSVELIFDQGLGEIFSVRIAGNIVNEDILGSMEFACQVIGSKLIVVLGHTRCGAIKGACQQVELGHLTGLLNKIQPAVEKTKQQNGNAESLVEDVAKMNVELGMDAIVENSPIIRQLLEEGKIGIVGGIYSVETGAVNFHREIFHGEEKAAGKNKMVLNTQS
jgi:carbonic anhydrase